MPSELPRELRDDQQHDRAHDHPRTDHPHGVAPAFMAAVHGDVEPPPADPATESAYQRLFRRNREWVAEVTRDDPDFFARRAGGQRPTFLFVGCADSRVPAELLTGVAPGEMFVHRNIANLALHTDFNFQSVLHYAVEVLQVKAVLVCGHYGCGGVRAAMNPEPNGFVDHWLRPIREVMRLHEGPLAALPDDAARERRLVELNAAEQAYNLQRMPVVEAAWRRGQPLTVHAMVYDLKDGLLHDLGASHRDEGELRRERGPATAGAPGAPAA